ncbi:MAG: hypothetical protein M0Z36_03965 [Thermaerobacter sp.]|nr:hypothetical protein [Thermaerobacter sp.]
MSSNAQTLNELFAEQLDLLGLKKWAWEKDPRCPQGHRRPSYAMNGDVCQDCLDAYGIDTSIPQIYPDTFRFQRRARNFLQTDILIGVLNAWADATDTGLTLIRIPNTAEPWRVQINGQPFWFGATLERTVLSAIAKEIFVENAKGGVTKWD